MTLSLSPEEALKKRAQLVEEGYCVVPGVLTGPFLEEMQHWTDNVLDTTPTPYEARYQGSQIYVMTERRFRNEPNATVLHDPIADRLADLPETWEACRRIGLEGQKSHDYFFILSKPAGGPALYWHQDWMEWNSPASMSPWPVYVFISFYLTDTTRENGCLRVIPGTHLKRIPLHDLLPDAHGPEVVALDENHPAFMNHPEAVDLTCKAGDLVICDGRMLHGAWPNHSDKRRTLVLQWQTLFPDPPSWWTGDIPDELRNLEPGVIYESTRTPGRYLR